MIQLTILVVVFFMFVNSEKSEECISVVRLFSNILFFLRASSSAIVFPDSRETGIYTCTSTHHSENIENKLFFESLQYFDVKLKSLRKFQIDIIDRRKNKFDNPLKLLEMGILISSIYYKNYTI